MIKKILCLAMILVMVASMAVIGVSAADTKIYFQVPSDWNNFKSIFCHIWVYDGKALATWQSKKEKCTDEGNGIYSYDIDKKVGGLEAGTYYGVIFSNENGLQTYNLLMSSSCYGDTVYCDGTRFENPEDSSKTAIAAYWKGQSKTAYGPILGITSIGNVVGNCLAPGATAESMFTSFVTGDYLKSAQTYSGKTDQAIIDDTATALGLSQAQVKEILDANGITVEWKMEESKAPEQAKPITPSNPGTTATGQETTIVYIALAMMLASAAVVFFARKKRVTE